MAAAALMSFSRFISTTSTSQILLQQHPHLLQKLTITRSFASYNPLDWWRNRQEKQQADEYKERLEAMASQSQWTVADMQRELAQAQTWMAKMQNTQEIKMAQELHQTLEGIIQVAGSNATDLDGLSRTDKLKAALAGQSTVAQVNDIIKQFENMSLMHRVLRKRKLAGKQIPTTADAMQTILQLEGKSVLSKQQRAKLRNRQAQQLKTAWRNSA